MDAHQVSEKGGKRPVKDLFSNSPYLLLDGAMGTMLQARGLKPGENPAVLNLTRPDLVEEVHRQYIKAGSRILLANTFGANREALRGTGFTVEQVTAAAIGAAKRATCGAPRRI